MSVVSVIYNINRDPRNFDDNLQPIQRLLSFRFGFLSYCPVPGNAIITICKADQLFPSQHCKPDRYALEQAFLMQRDILSPLVYTICSQNVKR